MVLSVASNSYTVCVKKAAGVLELEDVGEA